MTALLSRWSGSWSRRWQGLSLGKRRLVLGLVAVAAILAALRLVAPVVIRTWINNRLATSEPYRGRIGDVSLALWRGSYGMSDILIEVDRDGSGSFTPILMITELTIALDWSRLLRGEWVGTIEIEGPKLSIVPEPGEQKPMVPPPPEAVPPEDQAATPPAKPGEAPERWQDQIRNLVILRLDRIVVRDGDIEYRDPARGFAAHLGDVSGTVSHLVLGPQASDPATFHLGGTTAGGGSLSIDGNLHPLREQPTFTVKAAIEGVELTGLNEITRHFDHLTFANGTFSCYVELTAADGAINGWVKPIFRDLDVKSFRDQEGSTAVQLFWEAVVPIAEFILENDEKNQHAAKVPIEGRIDDPRTDPWDVLTSSLRNAFIQAIIPGFND